MDKHDYCVLPINRIDAKEFFLNKHYLKKWPRISYLFGLFLKNELVGAISYGTASSPAARKSVAGNEYSHLILELNRLYLVNNITNEASYLISRSIKLIDKPKIIISYADNDQGHSGIIYKAANFIYGGQSEGYHYDWVVKGKEGLHQSTLFREFKGSENKLKKMIEKYGDLLYKKKRSEKNRFVYIHSDKQTRLEILEKLNWKINE